MKILLLLLLLVAASPGVADVRFTSANLNVSTYGYIGNPSQPQYDYSSDFGLVARDLEASNLLGIQVAGTADRLDLSYSAQADFSSPTRVLLSGTSAITFDIGTPGFIPAYGQVGAGFNYSFALDRQTSLTIDYTTTKSISPLPSFGIGGDPARVFIYGSAGFSPVYEFAFVPNSTGRVTALLDAGNYNLGLLTILNGGPGIPAVAGGASGQTRITGTDRFDLQFGVVPEPATWATMIVGFAIVGAMRRRQSRGPTTARTVSAI